MATPVITPIAHFINNCPDRDVYAFEEKTKLILQECLKVRQKELFKAIVFKTITLNVPYLKTYNWQVKVVMSSDRLQNVKVPILQLDLVFESPNSKVNNSVPFNNKLSFELTKEELGTLVQTLEDAKQNLVQALAI
ncbi:PREDICTED: COMM domain-containing protein 8-like [Rhagoletis zephyria]|uniref:COMM domain-containing protein 8-like n=1 Tax=Rhagoletis zephyria TaxID=28612 RepID=UPI0008119ED6|nr:PREDICTED: COMM domain-containing protein 8-like [Rhagoletis zephyria]